MRNTDGTWSFLYCHCGAQLTECSKSKGKGRECKLCSNLRKQEERKERQTRYQWEAIKLLGGKCEGCNKKTTKDTMVCFDFHHIDKDNKNDEVSNMLASARPLPVILEEARKCILFCACCHRLHHKKYGY